MKEKVNLKKKIFNEYVCIFIDIILIYFATLSNTFDLLTVVVMPIFTLIAFIINPIRILILYNSELKKFSSKIKRFLYYFITIFPVLFGVFIVSFALISDYMYGK